MALDGPWTRRFAAGGLLLVLLALSACSGAPQRSSSSAASPSRSAAAPAACPNTDGGGCLGPLRATKEYATSTFRPAITYSVPVEGWVNEEDLPGNFLLLPPGNALEGVNAGTSDFIGVYASIAAEEFAKSPSCTTRSVASVADTPDAFVAWLKRHPLITATAPEKITVGGLHGLRVDIAIRPGARVPECTDDVTGERVEYVPILLGEGASQLDHGLIPDLTMRLYLLESQEGTLAIEVDDVASAPGSLATLSTVAEGLRFAPA
jgi:hypothetical protein